MNIMFAPTEYGQAFFRMMLFETPVRRYNITLDYLIIHLMLCQSVFLVGPCYELSFGLS